MVIHLSQFNNNVQDLSFLTRLRKSKSITQFSNNRDNIMESSHWPDSNTENNPNFQVNNPRDRPKDQVSLNRELKDPVKDSINPINNTDKINKLLFKTLLLSTDHPLANMSLPYLAILDMENRLRYQLGSSLRQPFLLLIFQPHSHLTDFNLQPLIFLHPRLDKTHLIHSILQLIINIFSSHLLHLLRTHNSLSSSPTKDSLNAKDLLQCP